MVFQSLQVLSGLSQHQKPLSYLLTLLLVLEKQDLAALQESYLLLAPEYLLQHQSLQAIAFPLPYAQHLLVHFLALQPFELTLQCFEGRLPLQEQLPPKK